MNNKNVLATPKHHATLFAYIVKVSREELEERKEKLGTKAKKDWDYHIGHLLTAIDEVFTEELGDKGAVITDKALKLYKDEFGQEAYTRLVEYRDLDYESVDDYEGI